ncbi:MAG: MAPEG family protein [Burkholderiaceae bacterium]|nr:MAPEG family protein [Burkholderiaceae bacterium]
MTTTLHWPALVTLATLALLFACIFAVGRARGRYQVPAPATSGPPEFDRIFRVQMNTLESTVLFLPALWLAALYFSPPVAAAVGGVWLLARAWYALAYARNPKSRGAPFVIAFAAWGTLMLLASWGVLRALAG